MIVLPDDFKYPIAAVVGTHALLVWQVISVENTRIKAKIPYPQLYAEKEEAARSKDAMIFNCTQRAHQNMLENVPILYSSVVIAGLKYPILAASLLGVYTLTRVPYTLGYKTGVADNRNALGPIKLGVPILASLAQMSLLLLSGWTAFKLFVE